jgi:hypothetical protein
MSERDEALMTFMAIFPDVDPGAAMQTLEATDWNVNAAIELHMAAGVTAAPAATATSAAAATPAAANIAADGISAEDAAAIARAAAEDDGADQVRAPIPAQQAVLNEPLFADAPIMGLANSRGLRGAGGGSGAGISAEVMRTFRNFGDAAHRSLAEAAVMRELENAPGGARSRELQGERLTDLFRPPTHLLTPGSWDAARAAARESRRWIIANVQDMTEFASQMLNRDTWKAEAVQDIVQQNFVLWQAYHDSALGQNFLSRYKAITEFPAIAIIDGRTGGLIQKFSGFVTPEDLVTGLVQVLDKYESEMLAWRAEGQQQEQGAAAAQDLGTGMHIPGLAPSSSTTSSSSSSPPSPKRQRAGAGDMNEDDALAAAIAASLEQGGGDANVAFDVDSDGDDGDVTMAAAAAEPAAAPVAPPPVIPDEPAQGAPGSTRLQLRRPDGSRLTRRFLKSEPVASVYGFARLSDPEALEQGRAFELVVAAHGSGAAEVIPHDDESATLESVGLVNAVVNMRWRD